MRAAMPEARSDEFISVSKIGPVSTKVVRLLAGDGDHPARVAGSGLRPRMSRSQTRKLEWLIVFGIRIVINNVAGRNSGICLTRGGAKARPRDVDDYKREREMADCVWYA